MEGFIESVSVEIQSCGIKNYVSHGACPASGAVGANFNDMIDSSICICEDGHEGISCMETNEVLTFALTGTTRARCDNSNSIDNNKNSDTAIAPDQCLEVNLKGLVKIERIVIWNSNSMFSNGSLEILDESQEIVKSESFASASASGKFDLKVHDDSIGHFTRIKTDSALYIAEVQARGRKLLQLDLNDSES